MDSPAPTNTQSQTVPDDKGTQAFVPTASISKERSGGIVSQSEGANVSQETVPREENEVLPGSGRERELEKELGELGLEKAGNHEVEVPEDLAAHGLKKTVTGETPFHAGVQDFAVSGAKLTDRDLTAGKKQPVNRSFRWFAEWFIYELLKAHFLVKFVKGEAVREKINAI